MRDKLILRRKRKLRKTGSSRFVVRVSEETYHMIDEIAFETGCSKAKAVSLLVSFAFDRVEYM